MHRNLVLVLLVSMACVADCVEPANEKQTKDRLAERLPRLAPKSPDEAMKTFRLQDGFQLELLASEPLVTSPVAMQYDENGLAYVVEMVDYPFSDRSKDQPWQEQTSAPLGRVRILEDNDGDGKFDSSTVFADGLSWPTGVACWKGGVYVCGTPDLWYFKDTDGDRKADVKEKVFAGFRKFNVQSVINNLQWGLDHWIYAAGSSNGGDISSPAAPDQKPFRFGRTDFRFHAQTHEFEAIAGGARFGNTFDDWGNRFLCNIRNPVQHVVLPDRYLARNPHAAAPTALHDVAEAGDAVPVYRISPPEPWRVMNAARLSADPDYKGPRSEKIAAGFVTSSSGVTIYRGSAYPPEYLGNAFVAEVAGNLVIRFLLSPTGPTFRAERSKPAVEFLASTENWFRPVNFVNAPDGTLHLLDMYRETIEHPWSIPDDIKQHLDLTSGRDRGRIYRLLPPVGLKAGASRRPTLGTASIDELVATLSHPDGWWRDTAHRLLFERQDPKAEQPLRRLLSESRSPLARLHALWSLDGLSKLTDDDLSQALRDESPGVREHALRLAEPRLHRSSSLARLVLSLAKDREVRVRFQAALTLGELKEKDAADALVEIAHRDNTDPWMRAAVLSSASSFASEMLSAMLASKPNDRSKLELLRSLATTVGARRENGRIAATLQQLATHTSNTEDQAVASEVVIGLGEGLKRHRMSLMEEAASGTDDTVRALLSGLFSTSRQTAQDQGVNLLDRLRGVRLMGLDDSEASRAALAELVDGRQPPELQLAAVTALASSGAPDVAALLLGKTRTLTPAVRAQIVETLLARQEWTLPLLEAANKGTVSLSQISPARRGLLLKHRDTGIRKQAEALFAGAAPSPRAAVIDTYRPALSLAADRSRGLLIYERECMNCHRLGSRGHEVGPNLVTIKSRTPAEVLVHVLDPNREIAPNYIEYVIALMDGRVATGVIAAETSSTITLRRAEGKEETIVRQEIDVMNSSGKSLMPEELEKKITPQEMANLIAFLLQPAE